ncbi:MAG: preprotein translocase subunit SecA [Bacteroidales bacterium]|nr:preprotein translocase subunit SecA [Bacteroidales bacterium]
MSNVVTNIIGGFFSKKSDRDIKEISPLIPLINQHYDSYQDISNNELRAISQSLKNKIHDFIKEEEDKIKELKTQLEENLDLSIEEKEKIYSELDLLDKSVKSKTKEILEEVLPEAFAVMKETAHRFFEHETLEVEATQMDRDLAAVKANIEIKGDTAIYKNQWTAGGNMIKWDMVHYDVQLIGGIVLHQGKIAEMATGEGKTLVATLPVFLNALTGKGVHLVTVNDYLAKRDSEWMGPLYEFHGLKVDCIDKHEPNTDERRQAYLADITFGTNNEFGFDYLRDNMSRSVEEIVQRGHNYAIVDEVDSVLIDDARTPLIISGQTGKDDEKQEFDEMKPKVEKLVNAQRNLINTLLADAKRLFSEGKEDEAGLPLLRCYRGLPKNKALIKFLSEQGVKALLLKTENLYMQDQSKNMPKVDEMLFFVIDEKNNSIEMAEKGVDLVTATTDDPHFFIIPDVGAEIAEMEKSNLSEAEKIRKKNELMVNFSIKSDRIHTINQLLKAYSLFEKDTEYVVLENQVKIVDEQTGRILEGRRYSDGLHQAIEAKENVKIEAATQTLATITLQNYFRMYHKLAGMTGTAETEAGEFWSIYKLDVVVIPTNRPVVRKDNEDLVHKTKREKYNAVITEIVDLVKNGRPVLVGTTSVEISELLSRMLTLRKIKHNVLNAKQHQREAEIVAEAGRAGTVTIATNMAGRGTDIKLGPGVVAAGGLAIIGTERHESRRVDRQLRGRSGRQGDPGSTQFFVSLEDDLMRLFGSDRIAKMMDRLGLKEGEVIQHSMITKSIERAQRKVEENNFGIRKRLLEYDDVMNSQREVIYTRRRNALYGERLSTDLINTMYDVCEDIATEYYDMRNFEGFKFDLFKTFGIESPYDEQEFFKVNPDEIIERIYHQASEYYKRKSEVMAEMALPVIKNIHENTNYENIVFPVTDGNKTINVLANLKKCYNTKGKELVLSFEKTIALAIVDNEWKEHLRELDDLKQSVQNAAYEQKDPLLIYKFESFQLFKSMLQKMNKDVMSFLSKGNLPTEEDEKNVRQSKGPQRTDMSKMRTSRTDDTMPKIANTQEQQRPEPVRVEKKVGRNDPCPCGSGKKYKNCHGIGS